MRVVFLDRDGVINENRSDHVKSWDEFQFLPGSLEALQALRGAGYHVFVVTNQAIIARGLATHQTLRCIHEQMQEQVLTHGGMIHDLRYCPHDTGDVCDCRKPKAGMLLDLAARWNVDLCSATMIGDAWTDIAAARTAGCRAVLVKTGRGAEQIRLPVAHHQHADTIAEDLWDAVEWLLAHDAYAPTQRELEPRETVSTLSLATPLCSAR